MAKVNEAYYIEDIGILQVVLDDGVVEHINPTEENEKLVLNGELGRYIELCIAEGRHLGEELGLSREFMMYDS